MSRRRARHSPRPTAEERWAELAQENRPARPRRRSLLAFIRSLFR